MLNEREKQICSRHGTHLERGHHHAVQTTEIGQGRAGPCPSSVQILNHFLHQDPDTLLVAPGDFDSLN